MKKRISIIPITEKLRGYDSEMGGVYTTADLYNLIGELDLEAKRRTLRRLLREGVLSRVARGTYMSKNPDLGVLASALIPQGYISADNILAKNGLIGTVPAKRMIIVSPKRKRVYSTPYGEIWNLQIQKNLMFGFTEARGGMKLADNEKAFLDLLYYFQKGMRFVVDPYGGIDVWKLNSKKLKKYLKKYKNPKFVKFVENIFDGTDRKING